VELVPVRNLSTRPSAPTRGRRHLLDAKPRPTDQVAASSPASRRDIQRFSLAVTFEGEFSDVTRSYAGKGVLRYSW
jgi:hypothetical protein